MDKRTERKNKIISDSIDLMYLKGYNATSVKDITDAAGIPKGSFYNYFEGKEQYAIDALKYYSDMSYNEFLIFRNEENKPLDRIKNFWRAKIEKLKKRELGTKYGCFVGNLSEEVGGVIPGIAEEAAAFHANIEQGIYDNLVEARKSNELTNELDDRTLARTIVSNWQGALLRAKVADDVEFIEDFYKMLDTNLLK